MAAAAANAPSSPVPVIAKTSEIAFAMMLIQINELESKALRRKMSGRALVRLERLKVAVADTKNKFISEERARMYAMKTAKDLAARTSEHKAAEEDLAEAVAPSQDWDGARPAGGESGDQHKLSLNNERPIQIIRWALLFVLTIRGRVVPAVPFLPPPCRRSRRPPPTTTAAAAATG